MLLHHIYVTHVSPLLHLSKPRLFLKACSYKSPQPSYATRASLLDEAARNSKRTLVFVPSAPACYRSSTIFSSKDLGDSCGPNRATGSPFRFTRNFSKFQRMLLPTGNPRPCFPLRKEYKGASPAPFTSILSNSGKRLGHFEDAKDLISELVPGS